VTLWRYYTQTGIDWDDCGGESTKLIANAAANIKCVEGGTLKDKIEGGGEGDGDSDGTDDEGSEESN
jgi:hypothetical protein